MLRHIGVTGSRNGPTTPQAVTFLQIFSELITGHDATLHHGDCVGVDAHCHHVARGLGVDVIIHPPSRGDFRAYCGDAIYWHPVAPYLIRNQQICKSTSVLIGLPSTLHERKRGGTWFTIRYGRAIQRKVIVINPNGSIG